MNSSTKRNYLHLKPTNLKTITTLVRIPTGHCYLIIWKRYSSLITICMRSMKWKINRYFVISLILYSIIFSDFSVWYCWKRTINMKLWIKSSVHSVFSHSIVCCLLKGTSKIFKMKGNKKFTSDTQFRNIAFDFKIGWNFCNIKGQVLSNLQHKFHSCQNLISFHP